MKKRSFVLVILIVLIVISTVTPATAATYQATGTRGVKLLAWSESKLLWSTNSTRVTASDANQDHSGFLVRNRGTTKVKSLTTSTQHAWNYKNEFLAGAKIGGQTIGFSRTITDRIIGKRNGKATFQWGI